MSSVNYEITEIENLTPHQVTLISEEGQTKVFPPLGVAARVTVSYKEPETLSSVPLRIGVYGETTGLPPADGHTGYIVSAMVRLAHPHRKDLLSPCELIRDPDGNIVACKSFEQNP